MKLNENINTVSSNISSDGIQMGIDQEGMAHIISILTDLYEDPEKTVIREYYSNALDSHKASGTDKKIQITLPTFNEPYFTVQDFGVGMSEHEMVTIYSSYGKSTKRDSNDQIGAFGLGCKSALSYTNQFTVSSIKDGEKTVSIISRREDGGSEMDIVSTSVTEEENGVTVLIPVNDYSSFQRKAKNFFYYIDPDLFKVKNDLIHSFTSDFEKVGDIGWVSSRYSAYRERGIHVLMGGILYPLSESFQETLCTKHGVSLNSYTSILLNCEIGDVDLTPSRESLRETPKTQEAVNALFDDFLILALESVQKEVDEAENRLKARSTALRMCVELGFTKEYDYYVNSHVFPEILTKFTYDSEPLVTLGDSCTIRLLEDNKTFNDGEDTVLNRYRDYISDACIIWRPIIAVQASVSYSSFKRWVSREQEIESGPFTDLNSEYITIMIPEDSKLTDDAKMLDITVISYDEYKKKIRDVEKAQEVKKPKPAPIKTVRSSVTLYKDTVILVENFVSSLVRISELDMKYDSYFINMSKEQVRPFFESSTESLDFFSRANLTDTVRLDVLTKSAPVILVPSWSSYDARISDKISQAHLPPHVDDYLMDVVKKITRSKAKQSLLLSAMNSKYLFNVYYTDHILKGKFKDPKFKELQKIMKTITEKDLQYISLSPGYVNIPQGEDTLLKFDKYFRREYLDVYRLYSSAKSGSMIPLVDILNVMYTSINKSKNKTNSEGE